MKAIVTVRLSLARPSDETSTMLSIALCLFFFNSLGTTAQSESSADLAAREHLLFSPLDESQNIRLYRNVDTAKREISFTFEAKTTVWVGFSISSGQGKMQGADIVIGWVKDGQTYFKASDLTNLRTAGVCVVLALLFRGRLSNRLSMSQLGGYRQVGRRRMIQFLHRDIFYAINVVSPH